MEGIEKITAKIAQDAQAEIDRLDRETQEQIDALSAQNRAQLQSGAETGEAVPV